MIESDTQRLEPGNIVTLLEVDGSLLGAGVLRFHSHMQEGDILWQGNLYSPWPYEADGFEMAADGSSSPRLKLANLDGAITSFCIAFDDMIGARVVRHRTMAKYLDGRPDADPNEHFPIEVWMVEQKLSENNEFVDFELSNSLNFDGIQLPRRIVVSNSCFWKYRSSECEYLGPPVADEYDNPTTDPAKDRCGKRLQSCKLRYGDNQPLPFGGFPAAGLT